MQVNNNNKVEKSLFGSALKDKNKASKINALNNRKSSSKSDHLLIILDGSILDVQNRNQLKNLIIDQEKFADMFSDGLEIMPDINQDEF